MFPVLIIVPDSFNASCNCYDSINESPVGSTVSGIALQGCRYGYTPPVNDCFEPVSGCAAGHGWLGNHACN